MPPPPELIKPQAVVTPVAPKLENEPDMAGPRRSGAKRSTERPRGKRRSEDKNEK